MSEYLRVKDNETGHEFTIRAEEFDKALHTQVDKPALDAHGEPADVKYRTSATKAAKAASTADTTKGS
jgi:hypothetical protein